MCQRFFSKWVIIAENEQIKTKQKTKKGKSHKSDSICKCGKELAIAMINLTFTEFEMYRSRGNEQ